MKITHLIILIAGGMLFSTSGATESQRYEHFPSIAAPDVSTAYCNLQQYNEKLVAILKNPELSADDMVKIHELSYTLENAVIRIQETIKSAATELEEVHLASERLDMQTIQKSGSIYLSAIQSLMAENSCQ